MSPSLFRPHGALGLGIAAFGRISCLFLLCSMLAFALTVRGVAAEEQLETLTVTTASGVHPFSVEVMRTGPQRERGLMFRRFLPTDRGMLFDFKSEQPIMMWMKNTYIPLDMIFISHSGKVVRIARNAEPLSERIVASGVPAYAVLEVNAGTAEKIGLGVGDAIGHPLFGK
jgi:uncharacterized membrane protein (UPF0127 family)